MCMGMLFFLSFGSIFIASRTHTGIVLVQFKACSVVCLSLPCNCKDLLTFLVAHEGGEARLCAAFSPSSWASLPAVCSFSSPSQVWASRTPMSSLPGNTGYPHSLPTKARQRSAPSSATTPSTHGAQPFTPRLLVGR